MNIITWYKVATRKRGPHSPEFEVFLCPDFNLWTWRERARNGQVNGLADQHYSTKWSAKRAAFAKALRVDGATVRVMPVN